jgi:hypothetical protein
MMASQLSKTIAIDTLSIKTGHIQRKYPPILKMSKKWELTKKLNLRGTKTGS